MDSIFLAKVVTWLVFSVKLSLTVEMNLDRETSESEPREFNRASTAIRCSDKIITNREGVITSPKYPDNYPNHISCTWHIMANMGEVVTIAFSDLDIEESGECDHMPCCVLNWVKIGPSLNGSEREYCGQNGLTPTFISSTPKVWVKFHASSVKNGGRGFRLLYTVGPRKGRFCDTNQIKCDDLKCLPQSARCNGFRDCSDGWDEKFCSEMCPLGKSCRSVLLCYDNQRHCDGISDCPDFSDELGCGICSANETRCGQLSSQCYNPYTQRCNRVMDCLNGEDEKDCLRACSGKIVCLSGSGCYSSEERCDGIAQCSDSSDEKNCGSNLCNYDRGGFLCGNGRCIREIWKCDRTNDCGDGTDEENCLRNSVLTAAVMGSLICALLLVIAISCTCRLYSLRAMENQMAQRETTLPRLSQEFLFREPPPSYAVAVGEHCRSLCVENVHYNPCSRRGRRRTRRARRVHELRRPSISTVESIRGPIVPQRPFLFPPPANPNLGINVLSAGTAQSNLSTAGDDGGANLQAESEQGCHQNDPSENPKLKKPAEVGKGHNRSNTPNDAESSFSEFSFSLKIDDADPTPSGRVALRSRPTENLQCLNANVPVTCDTLTFQSEHFMTIGETPMSQGPEMHPVNRSHCDIDMEPLIP